MDQKFIDELKSVLDESQILKNEPMSQHTSFRVGGPAELFLKPEAGQIGDIIYLCRQNGMPYVVLGNGSNILVADSGIAGVVIEIGNNLSNISINRNKIIVGAGATLSNCAQAAAKKGLSGMEELAGIPGSIGGAVTMNAGAYGGEIKNILSSAKVINQQGEMQMLTVEELQLGYRTSVIQQNHFIVVEAEFELHEGEEGQIRQKMKELSQRRIDKQPLDYPSAGSTFKRPLNHFAGKLIMDAGLAGFRVGGAMVSKKHCGFVINYDHATATDIMNLIQLVQQKVYDQFQIWLEPEVRIIK